LFDTCADKKLICNIIHVIFIVITICRRGNDSQRAVDELKKYTELTDKVTWIKDVIGGLYEWSMQVDKNFPIY